jgi:hypothetical protein
MNSKPTGRSNYKKENDMKLFIFISLPWLIAVILTNFLDVDISQPLEQYVGILHGLKKQDMDIRVKSTIFVEYLIIIPVLVMYSYIARNNISKDEKAKYEIIKKIYKIKELTCFKDFLRELISDCSAIILMLLLLEFPIAIKKNLFQWDITFSLLIMSALLFGYGGILGLLKIMKIIFIKLKSA